MPASIPTKCQSIADQLNSVKSLLADLNEEFRTTPPGPEKSRLFYEIRSARGLVGRLQTSLNHCLNPPPPAPDLTPVSVAPNRQPSGIHPLLSVANNGPGAVSGPYRIVFGVDYIISYDQDPPLYAFGEFSINVPPSLTIQPGATASIDSTATLPVLRRPGSSLPALFNFYVLVDADNQVTEGNEGNNYLTLMNQPVF